ncbi:MAG TPA: hypothetical protein VFU02_09200, partial [Polyangiaceae bacterium]|nr:hypothetical protein [Polyangiaceae bacterium]
VRVNEDGSVIAASLELPAESGGTMGAAGAFRWTESDGLVQLGGDSATPSTVHDISADGTLIVGQIGSASAPGPAYVWDEASGMQALGELLEAGGVDMTGWDLSGGDTQISADGNVVIGMGSCGGTRALYRAVLAED